jgi:hypothetical protein
MITPMMVLPTIWYALSFMCFVSFLLPELSLFAHFPQPVAHFVSLRCNSSAFSTGSASTRALFR